MNYPRTGISHDKFLQASKDLSEYIVEYYKSLDERPPLSTVQPGYLQELLPDHAPEKREEWDSLRKDLDEIIMKGMTHWQSSGFLAFFPTSASYPSILAESLISALSCIGFTWASSPSCTELEMVTTNWLAKAIDLPECFLHSKTGTGGGVIQGTASEATLMMLLSARSKMIRSLLANNTFESEYDILPKLVAYASEISHSSVERACLIAMVRFRKLPINDEGAVEGDPLRKAIEEDKKKGLIPLFVCATLGTTPCCSFDKLSEIGEICSNRQNDIWLHIDAAYAGCSFVCPEYRKHMKGIELADSFNFNPHKWLMVNFDCSVLWLKNTEDIVNSLNVNPLYLQHDQQSQAVDYRHWQIPLGRRFRSIKLWFVLRLVGVEGLRYRIREDISITKELETSISNDPRFEIVFPVHLALVCFRLLKDRKNEKKNREANERLLKAINDEGTMFLIPSEVNGKYFLRISIGSLAASKKFIEKCWKTIQTIATTL